MTNSIRCQIASEASPQTDERRAECVGDPHALVASRRALRARSRVLTHSVAKETKPCWTLTWATARVAPTRALSATPSRGDARVASRRALRARSRVLTHSVAKETTPCWTLTWATARVAPTRALSATPSRGDARVASRRALRARSRVLTHSVAKETKPCWTLTWATARVAPTRVGDRKGRPYAGRRPQGSPYGSTSGSRILGGA